VGIETALLGSAVIGAGSSIFGANKAASGAKKAAKLQRQQFEETKELLSPYTGAGENALAQYETGIGLRGREAQQGFYDDFQTDPGFETSLNNALDATMKKYSILGNTGGGLANALLTTGQNALYGQYQNRLSQLGGLVDTGRNAAGALAGFGQQSAAQQGNLLAQAGLYQGQGIMGAGNALSGGLTNLAGANLYQQGLASGQGGNMVPLPTRTPLSNRAMF
jgi:hypothetical protein